MAEITCSMCGHSFDPAAYLRCVECPLRNNCQLTCCPSCGYETVDIQQSVLARFASQLLAAFSSRDHCFSTQQATPEKQLRVPATYPAQSGNALARLKPKSSARVVGFAPSVSEDRRTYLQAYGITPGNTIWVQQSRPVTIVQVDHTELALDPELADLIYVTDH